MGVRRAIRAVPAGSAEREMVHVDARAVIVVEDDTVHVDYLVLVLETISVHHEVVAALSEAVVGDEHVARRFDFDRSGVSRGESLPSVLADRPIGHGGVCGGRVSHNTTIDQPTGPALESVGLAPVDASVFDVQVNEAAPTSVRRIR